MCLAALRLAMRAAGPAGGIYCCAGAGERQAQVRLVGADGADLPREALRQLESLVGKETEEPGAAAALGRSLPAPGGMERYAQAVAEAFGLKEAAPVGQPVAVAAPRRLRRWLEAVLAPWCELVWLDEPEPGGFAGTPGGPSPTGAAASARKAMRAAGAAFGACLHGDPPGERLFLWDGDGAAIDGDRLIAFFADIRLEGRPGGEVMLSAGASQRHEAFCRSRGGAAVRAPHALGELMQAAKGRIACALAADGRGGFVFPDLHPGPDGIAALACALAAGPGIGGRMAALPQFYMEERWVPCPVERTGHVLRLLAEEGAGEDAKGATDGVRVVRPEGWVLAVPEGSPPRFRLIAEGRDAASARRLAERYAKRIEALAEGA